MMARGPGVQRMSASRTASSCPKQAVRATIVVKTALEIVQLSKQLRILGPQLLGCVAVAIRVIVEVACGEGHRMMQRRR